MLAGPTSRWWRAASFRLQDYDYLKKAGVQGIYGPGSNVVECAADMLRLLGHNMPPVGSEMEAAE